ncbi:histidine kinase [bacterium]|nr:histidine kinase [bacterium]
MNDKWLRLIGIPVVALMALVYFSPESYYFGWGRFWVGILISLIHTIVTWEGNRMIHFKLRKQFPGYSNTQKRIVVEVVLALLYTVVITFVLTFLTRSSATYNPHFFEEGEIWSCIYESLFFSLLALALFMTIYEAQYFWGELKKNIQETESLARAHVETQLDTLKKQLDPHFLFNSLNTLSALIEPDNELAIRYLEQLSDVYRYVLTTRDKTTVPLDEELDFLEAYLYLNKTRFRENLQVEQKVSSETSRFHIPALSLQILVENAIKHNVVSKDKPLSIRIFQEGDFITVSNNKQLRNTLGESTRIGLENIVNRYNLLSQKAVVIANGDQTFSVKLPLLLHPDS